MRARSIKSWLVLLALAVAGCGRPPLNGKACANNPPGFCGDGMWCYDHGDWSMCRPYEDGGAADGRGQDAPRPDSGAGADRVAAGDGEGAGDAGPAVVDGVVPATPDVPPADTASVPKDARPDVVTCPTACTPGHRRCQGGVQECVTMGACTGWSAAVPCQGATTCVQSGTTASCGCLASACTVGARRCGSNGGSQECILQNGCATWSPESPGVCSVGATRCGAGGGVQECALQANGCAGWSSEKAPACTVGSTKCGSGGGVQECVLQANGCAGWGTEKTPACMVGAMKCGPGGGVQECALQGNGCAAWGVEKAPACTVGSSRCGLSGGIEECVVQGGGCVGWSTQTQCQSPKTCNPERSGPTCACPAATHMECSGAVCGLRVWTFESGSLEGATVDPQSDYHNVVLSQPLRVERAPGGSRAMGASLLTGPDEYGSQFAKFDFNIPLCAQDQTASVYQKKFSARIYIQPDRPPSETENVEVNLSPHIEPFKPAPFGSWFTYQGVFATPGIPVSLYSGVRALRFSFLLRVESPWTLTIWIDDVRIDE